MNQPILTTTANAVVSHSHGGKRRGREVLQSGWRMVRPSVSVGREDCTSRCADAWARSSESFDRAVDAGRNGGDALESGLRSVSPHGGREGSRQVRRERQALSRAAERDGASQVRRSTASCGARARLSERDGVKASARRRSRVGTGGGNPTRYGCPSLTTESGLHESA